MENISISIVRIKMKLDVQKEDFNPYPIKQVRAVHMSTARLVDWELYLDDQARILGL